MVISEDFFQLAKEFLTNIDGWSDLSTQEKAVNALNYVIYYGIISANEHIDNDIANALSTVTTYLAFELLEKIASNEF